jgi:hypothetical protein
LSATKHKRNDYAKRAKTIAVAKKYRKTLLNKKKTATFALAFKPKGYK